MGCRGGWACAALGVVAGRAPGDMSGVGAGEWTRMAEAGPDLEVRPGFRVVGFRAA